MIKLYCYKVARDYGFAPNPFWGVCSLACCKPEIRRRAKIDDWVIGGGSAQNEMRHRVVFAMRVTETMSFDEYWKDSRFQCKKPVLSKSAKHFFGDNIYHNVIEGQSATQADSHHSRDGGQTNYLNLHRDIGSNRVLLSDDYIYFGQDAQAPPKDIQHFEGIDFPTDVRNYQNSYKPEHIKKIISWLRSYPEWGLCDLPEAWKNPFS